MDSLLLGRRILLVEDEVMVSWALEQAIASLDCVVVGPAARVKQALAMIETEVFDAALLMRRRQPLPGLGSNRTPGRRTPGG